MAKLKMNLSLADLKRMADGMRDNLKEVENMLTTRRREIYGNAYTEVEMLVIDNCISKLQNSLNKVDVILNSFECINNEKHEGNESKETSD